MKHDLINKVDFFKYTDYTDIVFGRIIKEVDVTCSKGNYYEIVGGFRSKSHQAQIRE